MVESAGLIVPTDKAQRLEEYSSNGEGCYILTIDANQAVESLVPMTALYA